MNGEVALSPARDNTSGIARWAGTERLGWAYGFLAALIWGGYLAMTRQGIAIGLTAADLAFLRYATASLLMLPWLLWHDPWQLAGVGWWKGTMLALLAGPLFVLVGASGFTFAPLAHSAVIQLGSLTLIALALAAWLVGERPGRQRIIGMTVIVGGLGITAGQGLFSGGPGAWKGDLLFAFAGAMWALFTVLQRRWSVAPLAATAAVSVLSGTIYTPLYILFGTPEHLLQAPLWALIQQALMLGILSGVVALFAFSRAVEYLGASKASVFPAFAPAVAILSGIPLANEIPSAGQLIGLLVLSLGLYLSLRPGR